jgi:flagellar biosynthesis GTPase FlhF
MELAAAATVAGSVACKIAPKLLDFLEKNHKLRANLEHEINYITRESEMIAAAIREDGHRPHTSGDEVHKEWIKMVRDLAYSIDDCIDRFIHRVTMPTNASWIRQKLHRLKTAQARKRFATAILGLRKRSEDTSVLRTRYITGGGGSGMELSDEETETDTCVTAVGMEAAQDDLMELIMAATTKDEVKVISIVGFGGIGKTLLAKHAYNNPAIVDGYQARAWVRAAGKDTRDVLQEILRQLGTNSAITSSGGSSCRQSNSKLCATLRSRLHTKRYDIFYYPS